MNYRIFNFVAAILLACTLACKKNRYEVDPPAYIQIDSFTVINDCFGADPNRMDIVSHQITDAWIYVDGHFHGTYELPVKFPVRTIEGSHEIEIRPGIKKNGISATRVIYPFYEFYNSAHQLSINEAIHITPCVAYRTTGLQSGDIKIAWQEDFEGIVDLTYHDNSVVTVKTVSDKDQVFDGNFSGGIFLSKNDDFFEMISPELTDLPIYGSPIYLELNYRTNHEFFVGLYAQDLSVQENLYGFRAKDSWNKVYIELSEPIRYHSNSSNFNIFIGFTKGTETDSVSMYIDNIKLLHF